MLVFPWICLGLLLPLLESSDIKKASDVKGLLEIVKNLFAHVPLTAVADQVRQLVSLLSKDLSREAQITVVETLHVVEDRLKSPGVTAMVQTAQNVSGFLLPQYGNEHPNSHRKFFNKTTGKCSKTDNYCQKKIH